MGLDKALGRIIVITGLSGSGKSTALNALEDSGFFCIDNLPVQLLPKFLAFRNESNPEILKLGVVMDLREKDFIRSFQEVFDQIQSQEFDLKIVFLEASDETLVKRFSETRRRHPLPVEGGLLESIRNERSSMQPIRDAAHEVVDTTRFNVHQLRDKFTQTFGQAESESLMNIEIMSFGFKHGLPPEADILMDVRFLPNPYYLDDLRELDGRDPRIVDYVMADPDSENFLSRLCSLLEFVIPLYRREGKSYLTIAIGCTGGQHRSVTMVNQLAERLSDSLGVVNTRHRDIVRNKRECQ